jgi:CRP-like cAMP-binding protein
MSRILKPSQSTNRLLSRLSPGDLRWLAPHLKAVDLPLRKQLELRNKRIDSAYFIESGLASVVANGQGDRTVEVGIIGRDGVTGLAVIMGAERAPHDIFMQVAGSGQQLRADRLRDAMTQSETLRRSLLLYGHAYIVQTSRTALANARSKIEERLARWLLMAQDRMDDHAIPLTHEFLSMMLGVRRPGVTIALQFLEDRGMVRRERGQISIVDREGLKKISNGAYGASEAEFLRTFG